MSRLDCEINYSLGGSPKRRSSEVLKKIRHYTNDNAESFDNKKKPYVFLLPGLKRRALLEKVKMF